MAFSKTDILREMKIGNQVAEEERDTLREYFVETDSWKKVYRGDIDIVYGAKGAGKSALYVLIQQHEDQLRKRGITLVAAENLRGDPVFQELNTSPPTSEREFENIWRLYLLTLVGRTLKELKLTNDDAHRVVSALQDADLLPSSGMTLSGVLKGVRNYITRYTRPKSVETTVHVNEGTGGLTGFSGKIVFDEPDSEMRKQGKVSVAELYLAADAALAQSKQKLWLLLDRLDVAFDDSEALEKNALRALFRAYRTIRACNHIVMKIFLRTDIWDRISDTGFREATHLSRDLTLVWDTPTLQNLIVRRLLSNPAFAKAYKVGKRNVLADSAAQEALFLRVFPDQVEAGKRQSTTMDWIIKRTSDGSGKSTPRDVVLYLNALRDVQVRRLERGVASPPDETLFDRASFKEALPAVSEYRTTKVLFAEHPELKRSIEALREKKSEHDLNSLQRLWGVSDREASKLAEKLVEVGFFEKRSGSVETYWVPFVYRPYLDLSQGRSD